MTGFCCFNEMLKTSISEYFNEQINKLEQFNNYYLTLKVLTLVMAGKNRIASGGLP